MKEKLLKFFMPNKTKIVIFLLFLGLTFITGMAFAYADQPSKPFLYDVIKPIIALAVIVFVCIILAPTMILTVPLTQAGFGELILPIDIVYMYLLSCLIGAILEKIKNKGNAK